MAETLFPSISPILLLARLRQFHKLRFVNIYRQYMRRRRRKRHHSGCGFACGIQALLPHAVAGLLISPKWNLERKVFERFSKVLFSHSSLGRSPRPLERPSASASPVPSTNHSVLSTLSSPSHNPRPLEGPSPSPSPVPSTNLSGIKRKELTNCLQYLQPEQPGLSHGSVMLKDQIDNFCKICQVQCSGAFNLKQHFKGRKHKVKVEELELNRKYEGEKANQLQCCELCKVTCMIETLLKLHLQGKKHKEKQQLESLQHGEEIPNQPKWCELCKVTCMNETLLKQHFQGKKHKDTLQEVESLKHGEEIPNQLKRCELCKVTCMNETLMKQHFQGKKHKHKLQEVESLKHGEEIPNQPKWSELCKVTCMNETLLKQHFQGKKHKHKLQEVESLKHGEEIPNQPKWCELCKVTCMNETLDEPYYDEELSIPNSPDISGAERQPSLSNGYELYNSKLSSQDLYMEEANSSGMHGSHYQDKISQYRTLPWISMKILLEKPLFIIARGIKE